MEYFYGGYSVCAWEVSEGKYGRRSWGWEELEEKEL